MSNDSVSVLLVRPLIAALEQSKLPLARFFRATNLSASLIADHDARISSTQFCAAWSELIRLSGDPAIALRIAEAIPPGGFGIVEYVCRSAPTLREALTQWVRYLNLLDDAVVVALVDDENQAYLRVEIESEAPAPASHELCFAVVVSHARRASTVPFRPLFVEFTHLANADLAEYQRWFDAPVRFHASTTQLAMSKASLEVPIESSDPALLTILTRIADDLQHKASASEKPMTSHVKRVFRETLRAGELSIDDVARQLGITPRSLQRRLKDDGTAFQSIREDVRRELAERYLHEGLAIAEISFLLGFSEPSAFFRAFKRWTGLTPLKHRAID